MEPRANTFAIPQNQCGIIGLEIDELDGAPVIKVGRIKPGEEHLPCIHESKNAKRGWSNTTFTGFKYHSQVAYGGPSFGKHQWTRIIHFQGSSPASKLFVLEFPLNFTDDNLEILQQPRTLFTDLYFNAPNFFKVEHYTKAFEITLSERRTLVNEVLKLSRSREPIYFGFQK